MFHVSQKQEKTSPTLKWHSNRLHIYRIDPLASTQSCQTMKIEIFQGEVITFDETEIALIYRGSFTETQAKHESVEYQ